MNILFENLTGFMLIFARMAAMILFNPVLSRKNAPNMVRMGLVLSLTIILLPTISTDHLVGMTDVDVVLAIFMEVLVGFILGFVFQIYYYLLLFAGDFMDMQFGLSMAKLYDPSTSIQMSISGTFLTILFTLYFFSTGCHAVLFRVFFSSYELLPIGVRTINPEIGRHIYSMFADGMLIIAKLVMPFLVAEMILEAAMGVMMKLVPQIHVFVINIQFKMLLGMSLLFLFAVPISRFMEKYLAIVFDSLGTALKFAAMAA